MVATLLPELHQTIRQRFIRRLRQDHLTQLRVNRRLLEGFEGFHGELAKLWEQSRLDRDDKLARSKIKDDKANMDKGGETQRGRQGGPSKDKKTARLIERLKVGEGVTSDGVTAGGVTSNLGTADVMATDGVTANGVAADGVTSGGVSPDRVASDGMTPDGVASDGTTPDGVASDGVTADGVTSDADGMASDGVTVDGVTFDGVTVDGVTVDGSTVDGVTKDAEDVETALAEEVESHPTTGELDSTETMEGNVSVTDAPSETRASGEDPTHPTEQITR